MFPASDLQINEVESEVKHVKACNKPLIPT